MKISFDAESDALYIRLSNSDIAETAEVRPGVMLDYDAAGKIVGFEVLDASKNLSQPELKQFALEVA